VRPIRLDVEGFTSFKERQSIDFTGLDLFAITGPTGAGKSSLIDALVFALYGQVPRVGDDYKQLISHGAERLSVLLEFEVGRERYRIARTARRAGASRQHLERLDGAEARPLADRAREIRVQIEQILGLDYDGFTRAVVLPQGQFDEFLKGEPKERRKILVSLLNLGVYDAIQKLANQKGADARKEVAFIADQLEKGFLDATPAALEERRRDLVQAERECADLERALRALGEGLALAQKLRGARREVENLARDAAQEEEKRRTAEELLARGDEVRGALEPELADLGDRIAALGLDRERSSLLLGARPWAEQLASLRSESERLERAGSEKQGSIESARAALASARDAVPDAEKTQGEAEADLQAARHAREEALRHHAAAALRREIAVGEPCPVCEQTVPRVPEVAAPALEAAEARVTRAEKASRSAAAAAERARLDLQKAEAAAAGLERELAQLEEQGDQLASTGASLVGRLHEAGFGEEELADGGRLLADIQAELKALEAARRTHADLEAKRRAIEEKCSSLQAELAAATARKEGVLARLQEIASRREAAAELIEQTEPALRELAGRESWHEVRAGEQGRDEVDMLEARRSARQRGVTELAARVGALRTEVEHIEEKIARADELRERKRQLDAEAALLKTLSDHLRANELVAWIQEEALRRLAEDGSRHLAMLSQGRYTLRLGSGEATGAGARAEQDFFVVDRWNADGVRSVRTLSGGETFLASLALALALAESLARLSTEGRATEALDSLFLDEGFGALDGETLDTVVSALDALHGGQRLVGVVTHIRELAERMPARLEVRRSAGSAASAAVV
jgi:exonuclease SbcC